MTLAVAYAVTVGTLLPRPTQADEVQPAPAQEEAMTGDAQKEAGQKESGQKESGHSRSTRGGRATVARMAALRAAATVRAATASGCRRLGNWTHDDKGTGVALVQAAQNFLGCPYRFGGTTVAGFDCSGFVWYVHQLMRMPIPRRAEDQSAYAATVTEDNLQPGDLVFFHFAEGDPRGSYVDFSPNFINHVGIYTGEGRFIHAPKDGKVVSYARMVDFKPYFLKAGRYWTGSGMLARE
jgi:cell wall-associated NlpC family hydrolase